MRISARMTPGRLPEVLARRRQEALGITVRALERIARSGLGTAEAFAPEGPSHNYKRGLGAHVETGGDRIEATVGNRAPHAGLVEKGRRPGKMPPVGLISRLFGAAGFAFAIARAIGRRGTEGHHVIERTRDAMEPEVRREARRLLEDLGRLR